MQIFKHSIFIFSSSHLTTNQIALFTFIAYIKRYKSTVNRVDRKCLLFIERTF